MSRAAKLVLYAVVGFVVLYGLAQLGAGSPPASSSSPATPTTVVHSPESRRNPSAAQLASFVVKVGEERCPMARRTFLQGVDAKQEVWNVECSTGKSYAVTLENSGTVRVLGCGTLRAVSKVECFKTFDEQR